MYYDVSTLKNSNPGKVYKDLWDAFVAQMGAFRDALNELQEAERTSIGVTEHYGHCFVSDEHTYERRLCDKAKTIADHLKDIASIIFAPSSAKRLEIEEDYAERFIDRDKIESFNPQALWDAIVADLGGGKGQELGYQQSAENLVDFFHLKKGTTLQITKGRVILNRSVFIDSMSKKYGGKTELGYHCAEDLGKAMLSLKTFAEWASDDELAILSDRFAERWWRHNKHIESREKCDLGEGLEVVTYLNRFEFRFSMPLATKLQEFVSIYGASKMKDAA